jgi:DNA-binding HxlR family transcriptional regulator
VPVVATLARYQGCRFVELLSYLGASRDTLSETLSDLTANGLVMRNPGYGHPLRPEYILTPAGWAVAAEAQRVVDAVSGAGVVAVALKKWPMLVLTAIGRGACRFGELRTTLTGITPRALAGALKDLETAGLATRRIETGYPPATSYALTAKGAAMLPALDALVRACSHPAPPSPAGGRRGLGG